MDKYFTNLEKKGNFVGNILEVGKQTAQYIWKSASKSMSGACAHPAKSVLNFFSGNDPTKITLLLASSEAILRPVITLSNKKEDKNKRETAALTEFVLQLVVIPTVIAIPTAFKVLSNVFHKAGSDKKTKTAEAFFSFLGLAACNFVIPPMTKASMSFLEKHGKRTVKPGEIKLAGDVESKLLNIPLTQMIVPENNLQKPKQPFNKTNPQTTSLLNVYRNVRLGK